MTFKYRPDVSKASGLVGRYGETSLNKFEQLLWEKGSLSAVAKYFNFTRAYASYLFKEMYGVPFKEYKEYRRGLLKQLAQQSYEEL